MILPGSVANRSQIDSPLPSESRRSLDLRRGRCHAPHKAVRELVRRHPSFSPRDRHSDQRLRRSNPGRSPKSGELSLHQLEKLGNRAPVPPCADCAELLVKVDIGELGVGHTVGKLEKNLLAAHEERVAGRTFGIKTGDNVGVRDIRQEQNMERIFRPPLLQERVIGDDVP